MVAVSADVSLYYERCGSGPQVVLVPNRLFMPEFRQLCRPERTVIQYDMRNRGNSSRVADTALITIGHDIEDVEALRRHFRAERVSLIGYSYLGLMVAAYATAHPARVERMVQIGPVPREFGTSYPADQTAPEAPLSAEGMAAERAWEALQPTAGDSSPHTVCLALHRYMAFRLVGNPANHRRVPNVCRYANELADNQMRHMRAHFGDIQKRTFPRQPFTQLEMPVLTIHGTFDRNAPYGAGLEWATTFRNGRLITVAGGAHQVWLDDAAVISDIDMFLGGAWPARAQSFGRED
jgi:pimeloyl-ACP methyl ester carboxylesterase